MNVTGYISLLKKWAFLCVTSPLHVVNVWDNVNYKKNVLFMVRTVSKIWLTFSDSRFTPEEGEYKKKEYHGQKKTIWSNFKQKKPSIAF